MRFHADLHLHSKYARACSKDADLEHLTRWARRKGIAVLGTGDFTHPEWLARLRDGLVAAEPGLFRLREDLEADFDLGLPPSLTAEPVRFMLSTEISTVYESGGRTRKIHHLLYMPDFDAAAECVRRLAGVGELAADGRPTLRLDARDLLATALDSGDGGYLVPAHAWTPWFGVLGSKTGFDRVEDCYGDLADRVFALETGLSSDPAMNWRVSGLDRYRMVSYSDAHSPPMLGRETTVFDTDLDYHAIRRALETGDGHAGSVEFFPEGGKYHLDGHRRCGVRLEPERTRELGGRCPVCGRRLTVGVLSRVEDLADRPEGARPPGAAGFKSLVPLAEIVSEIVGTGPKSKKVRTEVDRLTADLGPELPILEHVPIADIESRSPLLAEAVARLREGKVIREAGYDGEFGQIRLFAPGEVARRNAPPGLPLDETYRLSIYCDRKSIEGVLMGKLTILALRVVLALVLAGTLFVQGVMVPLLGRDLEGVDPDYAHLRVPLLTVIVLGVLAIQVVLVCVWRLVTMVRRGKVFSPAAFRYVDVIIGAVMAAALSVWGIGFILAPTEVAPGIVLLIGGIGLGVMGVAFIVLVLRMLLAQAIARDTEAHRLQSELDEVI